MHKGVSCEKEKEKKQNKNRVQGDLLYVPNVGGPSSKEVYSVYTLVIANLTLVVLIQHSIQADFKVQTWEICKFDMSVCCMYVCMLTYWRHPNVDQKRDAGESTVPNREKRQRQRQRTNATGSRGYYYSNGEKEKKEGNCATISYQDPCRKREKKKKKKKSPKELRNRENCVWSSFSQGETNNSNEWDEGKRGGWNLLRIKIKIKIKKLCRHQWYRWWLQGKKGEYGDDDEDDAHKFIWIVRGGGGVVVRWDTSGSGEVVCCSRREGRPRYRGAKGQWWTIRRTEKKEETKSSNACKTEERSSRGEVGWNVVVVVAASKENMESWNVVRSLFTSTEAWHSHSFNRSSFFVFPPFFLIIFYFLYIQSSTAGVVSMGYSILICLFIYIFLHGYFIFFLF